MNYIHKNAQAWHRDSIPLLVIDLEKDGIKLSRQTLHEIHTTPSLRSFLHKVLVVKLLLHIHLGFRT